MDENYSPAEIKTSRFFMIRCLIAIAHIDNIMHPAEEIYLRALINHLNFDQDEMETLRISFREPEDLSLLVPKVIVPRKKLQLMYFARILAYKDEALHINEINILQKIDSYFSRDFDIKEINAKTASFLKQHNYLKDTSAHGIDRGGYTVPWFQLFDEFMMELGIDFLKN